MKKHAHKNQSPARIQSFTYLYYDKHFPREFQIVLVNKSELAFTILGVDELTKSLLLREDVQNDIC